MSGEKKSFNEVKQNLEDINRPPSPKLQERRYLKRTVSDAFGQSVGVQALSEISKKVYTPEERDNISTNDIEDIIKHIENTTNPKKTFNSGEEHLNLSLKEKDHLSIQENNIWNSVLDQHNIERAKQGFETFRKIYESGDKSARMTLTKEAEKNEIQALLLGLKPQVILDGYSESLLELFKAHAGDDFIIKKEEPSILSIYSKISVEKILNQYPNYFPDYVPGSPIDSYLLERTGESYRPSSSEEDVFFSKEENSIREGLLYGYPLSDVEQHAKFSESSTQLMKLAQKASEGNLQPIEGKAELLENDQNILATLFEYSDKFADFEYEGDFYMIRKSDSSYLEFLEKNKDEISKVIDRYELGMSENEKQYAIHARLVGARGFAHLSANPNSNENRAFIQNIDETFEQSGINNFLKNIPDEQDSSEED